jgi:pyrimidine-specific ribonucleoside hydrolase
MRRLLILTIGLFLTISLYSHPWKPSHYVIIDTDGGIDDIRTITMLLASPDVRVLGITISPGSLGVSNAYIKVKSLLKSFYHEGIPVGINRSSSFKSPEFGVALSTLWGNETGLNEKDSPDCLSLISEILNAEKTKISFISLGSLSTVSMAVKELSSFSQQVKEVIWSGSATGYKEGFNYKADIQSSENVIKGKLPLVIVTGLDKEPFYNDTFVKTISEVNTVYAGEITGFFNTETAKNHKYSFSGTDEMAALYLHFPKLFVRIPDKEVHIESPANPDSLREAAVKILAGETVAKNQVIKEFPVDPSFYFSDIEPSVSSIVKKYGKDEFISGVIANELHRHLGAFAIIGVKMGIRAREYFDTGVDEFSAVSFAGSMPPLSCMNDGIQVSTGATPGHGLLTVRNDTVSIPVVDFTYLNRKIRLTLKPEIAQKISNELKEINYVYGLDSNIYWELVRKNSIKYWLNLDRHEIFSISEIR